MPLGLVALAIGAFGIGLTEFVIMGLLPEVAADFGVSEAAAGWLISGYALAVVVGALVLTAATTRLPRKPVLLGLIVLFIVGNILTAVAGDYGTAMVGRIIAALCHGAFFGIGSVVAASLVPAEKKAGAIAIMFTGLTAANVFGVPFGTFLGQQFTTGAVPWLLVLFGVGLVIGNWLGGRLADRSVDGTLIGFIAALVVVLALFAVFAGSGTATIIALFLMGGFGFGTVPGLQSRIMNYAGTAPTLASGANIGAFNVGNAIGAWAGGVGIAAGLGYTSPIWIGASITAAALVVMIIAAATGRAADADPSASAHGIAEPVPADASGN